MGCALLTLVRPCFCRTLLEGFVHQPLRHKEDAIGFMGGAHYTDIL